MTNRTKAQAQKRAAQQQAARKKQQDKNRRAIWAIVAVVAAIVLIVVIAPRFRSSGPSSSSGSANAIAATKSVPAAAFEAAGVPAQPSITQALPANTPPLEKDGKPEILYIGAEYCPYCAAERWPLIVALSRFGTFSGLESAHSSSTDLAPNTNTFTFLHSTYDSSYLSFSSVETADQQGNPLQTPTAEQQQLMGTYNPQGSIPFVLYGNRYVTVGAGVSPEEINPLSYRELATAITDPSSSKVGKDIVAQSNVMTAAMCQLTGGEPGDVCNSSVIQQATAKLPTP
jgi:thiol-disulfide isomerase/thioredoxin